jgi:predicted Zn-dependent peptidase
MGERRVVVKKYAQLPALLIAHHVPESASPDYYALSLLQAILFSGQSSRLYQRVVDKDQLAISINGATPFSFDPTLLTISVQPKAGVDPQTVEKVVYEELERVKKDPVADQELEKARNIVLALFYRQMSTISGRANTLGTYEIFFGDYHKLFTAVDSYNKVTKADLQRVAQKYFDDKNRTVAILVPEKETAGKAEPAK